MYWCAMALVLIGIAARTVGLRARQERPLLDPAGNVAICAGVLVLTTTMEEGGWTLAVSGLVVLGMVLNAVKFVRALNRRQTPKSLGNPHA